MVSALSILFTDYRHYTSLHRKHAETVAALQQAEAERDAKERARAQIEGLRWTAQASAALAANPGLSLLLAMEGAHRAPGAMANNVLRDALDELPLNGVPATIVEALGDSVGVQHRESVQGGKSPPQPRPDL